MTAVTVLMSEAEARVATKRIKDGMEDVTAEIANVHDREGWRALGYKSWGDYIAAEFPFTRQHSYDLVDQGRVMRLLAAEVGRPVELTIREAKVLKKSPQAIKQIGQLVADGAEPREAVRQVVQPITVARFQGGYFHEDEPQSGTCPNCGKPW